MGKSFKPMIDAAINKLRDEFEESVANESICSGVFGKLSSYGQRKFWLEEFRNEKGYSHQYLNGHFQAFKAGYNTPRESLAIELPNTDDFGDEEILYKYKELVKDKLMQSGITVKE